MPRQRKKERENIRKNRLGKKPDATSSDGVNGDFVRRISNRLVMDAKNNVACQSCGHVIGPATENYKSGLVRKDNGIQEANPLIVDPKLFIDPEMVFRQFFCPSCATQIETEVVLAASDPVWDKQLAIK